QTVYGLLMRVTAQALMTLAAERRGAKIGLIAVLHTWGQTLTHHPHVHCLVPGGGVALDGQRWVACKPNFLLSVRALSKAFRRLSSTAWKPLSVAANSVSSATWSRSPP